MQNDALSQQPIIYIDAPTFTGTSNGIRCVYYLAQELSNLGCEVIFVPRSTRGFWKKLPTEFSLFRALPVWEMSQKGILICSESVPAKTIATARRRGIRIIWWYLAPHALLEPPKAKPRRNEVITVFSSYVLLNSTRYYFYQPPFDTSWKQSLSIYRPRTDQARLSIAFYTGKGRLKALPRQLQSLLYGANFFPITRDSPSSRQELFSLLHKVDGLITFDELSQLSMEAITLGVPVFRANPLYPEDTLSSFPVAIAPYLTCHSGHFIELVHKRRSGTLKPLHRDAPRAGNPQVIKDFMSLIADLQENCDGIQGEKLSDLANFGRRLRRLRVLYPQFNGQAAGSSLFPYYLMSISERRFIHQAVSTFASILDEIGRTATLIGMGFLYKKLAQKVSKSEAVKQTGSVVVTFVRPQG
jgi:hypothetical protein